MATPPEFDDIRPYNDDEVRPTLNRLLQDTEFLDTVAKLKLPKLGRMAPSIVRPLVRKVIQKELVGVNDVHSFQMRIETYMQKLLDRTAPDLTVSGLEHLSREETYCFISNHRDITMDAAFVNWVLFHNQFKTLRIAIGDNLLTKAFASDLMRLNKSFIVNRSATAPREKLKAAKKLSSYILHSITEDKANIWIAQREGRAKDGKDKTNPAILSMLMLAKSKTEEFTSYLQRLCIVPVSISYEFDPCDEQKARELTVLAETGTYVKGEQEDVQSIACGIRGFKGHVHLAFGKPIVHAENVDEVISALDDAIWRNYVLHPTNCLAYEILEGNSPDACIGAGATPFKEWSDAAVRRQFKGRLEACDPRWRQKFLQAYANPVYTKLGLQKL